MEETTREYVELAKKYLALYLAENPNYTPTREDVEFAKENPNTDFAKGLAVSPNYIPTREDVEWAGKNIKTGFALKIKRKIEILKAEAEFAKTVFNSLESQLISQIDTYLP